MTSITEQFDTVLSGSPGDLGPFYKQALEESPVFWSEAAEGWIVSRYSDIKTLLADRESFGPLIEGKGSTSIYGRNILHMDGIEHRRKDAFISKHIRNRKLLSDSQENYIRTLCKELVDALPLDDPIDLKSGFTTPMPLIVTAWIMDMEEATGFRTTYDRMVAASTSNQSGDPDILRDGLEAIGELQELITPRLMERRSEPGGDYISTLCEGEYEGAPISDAEILSSSMFLLAAGVETTDRALANLLRILISEPELWIALQTNRDLLLPALAEGLRFCPPVHAINRATKKNASIGNQEIPADSKVLLLLAAANRDPEIFDEPDHFRLDRFAENAEAQFSANATVLSFSHDTHFCTGSLLAKLEMIEGMNLLLDTYSRIEWTETPPEEEGYILRGVRSLPVKLQTN
jgi:cytochrome P450